MADVHSLKDDERLPSFYIKEIYHQFIGSYEAMADDEEIDEYVLPLHGSIYHLLTSSRKPQFLLISFPQKLLDKIRHLS